MTDPARRHAAFAARPAPDGTFDPDAIARLRLVVGRLYRQMTQASSGRDLTFAQLSALARVEQHGPLRLGELAVHERVAAPSMTRTIAPLVSDGLIGKEPDPNDRRSWLVAVTPVGRELIARMRRERSELLARRIARLDPVQRDTLHAAIPVLELLLTDPQEPSDDAAPSSRRRPV